MANNRLYIRCRHCNNYLMIAKHLLTPWAVNSDFTPDGLQDFFDEHTYCLEFFNKDDYIEPRLEHEDRSRGYAHFDIAYEFEDD